MVLILGSAAIIAAGIGMTAIFQPWVFSFLREWLFGKKG